MSDEEIVAVLAAALHERLCGPLIGGSGCLSCCDDAAALLPVVRRIVLAAAARDAEKVRRVEELADWLDKCAEDTDRPNDIVAANVTPERLALLGRVYRDDADRIRRALAGP